MEAIGTLAGGIAHDFNNILAGILAAAELLHLQTEEQSPTRPALEVIFQATRRARELTRQILTFSRRGKEEWVPFNLSTLVEDATRLLKATLPGTVIIRQEVQPEVWVLGDPTQMHQVFMNLTINGYHALGSAGGSLVLDLRLAPRHPGPAPMDHPAAELAVLTVRDSGCGMEPELLERIFDPFFTTKTVREGTGLGLAVVHGIIHKHKGSIQVTSAPGQGSRFQVTLPATLARPEARTVLPPEAFTGTERILLVDDEDLYTALAKRSLQERGYLVTAKTCGRDALEAFQEAPDAFDLLVTDQDMPDLGGAGLTAAVRKLRPDLPVILVTGLLLDGQDPSTVPPVGFQEVLLKPLYQDDLARAIRRVLDGRAGNAFRRDRATSSPQRRRPMILLATDHPETRVLVRAALVSHGYEVRVAVDGQEAWNLYLAAPDPRCFAMLITDLALPRMDGMELIGKVRQCDPALPIVVLSASGAPESRLDGSDLRISVHQHQPFDARALLACVRRYDPEG